MRNWCIFILFFLLASCTEESYDLILLNAKAYTVDKNNPWAEAIAIKDGKIAAVGSNLEIKELLKQSKETINCENQFLMPGFIEGHGHFAGLGGSLVNLNLLRSKSWEQIVEQVKEKVNASEKGEWIVGRGWHQEKWDSIQFNSVEGYPRHHGLSEISPSNPVVLYHASGHSLFANKTAMDLAGINQESKAPMGGKIIRDHDGNAIGVFEERAMNPIKRAFKKYEESLSSEELDAQWHEGIRLAQEDCLKKGITSFQDAGAYFDEIPKYQALAEAGKLDVRLWSMLRHSSEEMQGKLGTVKQVGTGNNFFTCNAIKTEIDGALGSFGAWLLEPYNDKQDFYGQNTTEIEEVKLIAAMAKEADMQLCIHSIGDKANRIALDIITSKQEGNKDHRWRIEHAQHLHPDDIKRFASTGTIAAMQGIHCTSDAPFVEKRLGRTRSAEGAYPWQSLLSSGAIIANGTDAPVEDVDPIESFYASVTRKRVDNGFAFFPEQSMTREQAIASYTIHCAYAAFEDKLKGSIEVGKMADFVMLSKDLVRCTDEEILESKVLLTIVDGKVKYNNFN